MEINSRTLRVYCAVMDTRSLVAASARVALSPSAISRIISGLERDLAARLFNRSERSLTPTPAGHRFHGRAREALLLIDDLTSSATMPEDEPEPLRIAALSRHARSIVAPAIAGMLAAGQSSGPILFDMHAQRDFGFSRLARPFDIGFGNLVAPQEELDTRVLAHSELVIVIPPCHDLHGRNTLAAPDLVNEPIITLSRDTIIGRIVKAALDPIGKLRVVAEVSHTYLALDLVAAGHGLHATDRLAALDARARGCALIPIAPRGSIPFLAFWPKRSSPLSGRALAVVSHVENVLTSSACTLEPSPVFCQFGGVTEVGLSN